MVTMSPSGVDDDAGAVAVGSEIGRSPRRARNLGVQPTTASKSCGVRPDASPAACAAAHHSRRADPEQRRRRGQADAPRFSRSTTIHYGRPFALRRRRAGRAAAASL